MLCPNVILAKECLFLEICSYVEEIRNCFKTPSKYEVVNMGRRVFIREDFGKLNSSSWDLGKNSSSENNSLVMRRIDQSSGFHAMEIKNVFFEIGKIFFINFFFFVHYNMNHSGKQWLEYLFHLAFSNQILQFLKKIQQQQAKWFILTRFNNEWHFPYLSFFLKLLFASCIQAVSWLDCVSHAIPPWSQHTCAVLWCRKEGCKGAFS